MSTAKRSLSFRIVKNGQLVRTETLTQGVIKIGKVPSAHLRIDDEKVSRMHAIIEVMGSEISVIDLGSTGGTFVNGQKVNKAKLQSGDTISVGDTQIEFALAEVEATPSVPTPSVIVAAQVAPPPVPAPVLRVAPTPAPQVSTMNKTPITQTVTAAPVAPLTTPPTALASAMAEQIDGGAGAVEVAQMFGDSVVNVKHCMDPRGGKVTPLTWGFAAGGLVALIASATAFGLSVNNAATNKAALDHHVNVLKRPAHAFRPVQQGAAVDVFAFGGLALGLAGLTTALARSRRERKSPYYRIGTAKGVEAALEHAPAPAFPLVAPQGDDFVFNYAPGIDGELTVNGQTTPLADLMAQGRARPSSAVAGAIEVPIPMAAKIRARAGATTFLVSAVNKPREQAMPLFAIERRTVGYVAGSLAAHMLILAGLNALSTEGSSINVDMASLEDQKLVSMNSAKEDQAPDEQKELQDGDDAGKEGAGAKMRLDEGAAGKPDSARTDGHMEIKNNSEDKHLSRDQAIKAAQEAGVLGSTEAIRGGIAALTANDPFSSGFDGADIYGPLFGSQGEGRGNFGFGRSGFGAGGGCTQEPCGIVGTGRYGTFGTGRNAGDGWRGGGTWGRPGGRTGGVPKVAELGTPITGGNLDKAIIKRYIKRHYAEISYCYESELLARPELAGAVTVNFLITGTGSVQQSTGAGFDNKVASCVAGVIKNIEFPRPTDGGNVQVNYPFNFRRSGQ